MNAKTEQQIQRMKQQTIGVEIEMNHTSSPTCRRLFRHGQMRIYCQPKRIQHLVSMGCTGQRVEVSTGQLHLWHRHGKVRTGHADFNLRRHRTAARTGTSAAKSRSHQPRRRRGWGTHSHWSKRTHTAELAKPCQHHGKPRAVTCGCPAPRPEPDASLLPNRQPEFHRTAEPKKAYHHGTACGYLVYHKRGGIRQNTPLQRQPLSHDQLPRPFHERDD